MEMLVTVSIVAGLAAVAAIATQNALRKGRQSVCMSNMRNIGAALHLHAAENGGNFPLTTHSTTLDKAWIYALEGTLGRFDESRVCPADPKREERLAERGTSYILNSYVFVPKTDAFGRATGPVLTKVAAIPDLSGTLLAVVCSDSVGASPGNDHTHSDRWNSWVSVRRDVATARHGAGGEDGTDGGSNYLYADGHVKFIRASEFKSRVEAGDNPALPPGITL